MRPSHKTRWGGLGQQCWCCGLGHFFLQFCGSSLKLCWSGSSSKILLLDPTNNLYTTTNFLSKPKPHNIFIERNTHYIKTSSKNTSTWTNVQDFEIYITFWCYFSIYLCKPMIGFWSELFIQIRLPVFFWIRNRPTIGSIALEEKIFCDKKTQQYCRLDKVSWIRPDQDLQYLLVPVLDWF